MRYFIRLLVLLVLSQPALARNLPVVTDIPEGTKMEHHRGFIETHNAIESMSLRISMDDTLHGFVEGKVCDECETIKVNVTPETKAYSKNVEVPLKRAMSRIGRYATVIYELKSKNVSEIRW